MGNLDAEAPASSALKAIRSPTFRLFNPTLLAGALLGLTLLLTGLWMPRALSLGLRQANGILLSWFGLYYLWAGLLIVAVAGLLLLLPLGRQRLGDGPPEFSFFSWIALLYSTGMGSGLLLRAVQEPVFYYQHPPVATAARKELALQYTYFHWGLTPWAMYSVFGLLVAYRLYRQQTGSLLSAVVPTAKRPLVLAYGLMMSIITLTGVVASLALGAAQFSGGLRAYDDFGSGRTFLLLTATGIGLFATASALTGLHRLIRYLADLDLLASLLLLAYVACFLDGPEFVRSVTAALGQYLTDFVDMSLAIGRHRTTPAFQHDWTVFYWAFWLAWVPFTGLFMARISRGRTVREYMLATLIIPAFGTLLWFSVFAHQALSLLQQPGTSPGAFDDVYTSLFRFLEHYPLGKLASVLALLLVLIAVINSVDSAIYVLSIFSQAGNPHPSVRHKLAWGGIITATATGLVALGNDELLGAVGSLLTILALPFSLLYLFLIARFLKQVLGRP